MLVFFVYSRQHPDTVLRRDPRSSSASMASLRTIGRRNAPLVQGLGEAIGVLSDPGVNADDVFAGLPPALTAFVLRWLED